MVGDGSQLIGAVGIFAGNFAPRTYAFCHGDLLAISSNSALFSILGTIYGGDGRTTFGLPDLRGRVAMGAGNGPGLTSRSLGQKSGTEYNYLTVGQLPAHSHTGYVNVADGTGDAFGANGNYLAAKAKDVDANPPTTVEMYKTAGTSTFSGKTLAGVQTNNTGSTQAINNIQPYLVLNYCIALQGIYPSRN